MKVLTEQTFAEVDNTQKAVVYFTAAWCGPCKGFGPVVEKTSEERPELFFGKVDIDEAQELTKKFGVRGVPTTILFSGGQPVDRKVGAMSKSVLDAWIDSTL